MLHTYARVLLESSRASAQRHEDRLAGELRKRAGAAQFRLADLLAGSSDPRTADPLSAVRIAEQAQAMEPVLSADQWAILAKAYGSAGQLDRASEAIERAIGEAPRSGSCGR